MCEYCEPLNETGECKDIIYEEGWTDRFHLCKFPEGTYRIECYASDSSPINFCPMCGRNLNEDVCGGIDSTNAENVNP